MRFSKRTDGQPFNVVRIWNGLGNQMFQYAFGCALSKASGVRTCYDVSWFYARDPDRAYGLDRFCCDVETFDGKRARRLSRDSRLLRLIGLAPRLTRIRQGADEMPALSTARNSYFIGYFQSAKYCEAVRDDLLKAFRLREIPDSVRDLERTMQACESVALHVRRGDYLLNTDRYCICGVDYYARAVNLIRQKVSAPRFFVFSDDIPWCRAALALPDGTTFVDLALPTRPELDLHLMSQCRHNIIANSTFSWWGAWLNTNPQKTVVAPAHGRVGGLDANLDLDEKIPSAWIRL